MGKTITPAHRIEVTYKSFNGSSMMTFSWDKRYGKVCLANLEKFVEKLNASTNHGGVNFHLSEKAGYILFAHSARIVRQADSTVKAEWKAPMFQEV